MVSSDKLSFVVNTHEGKRRFKDINTAVNFLNLWRQMHNSYLSAFMTVEINKNLHKKRIK
jgi:RNA-splicing ligase RtcB